MGFIIASSVQVQDETYKLSDLTEEEKAELFSIQPAKASGYILKSQNEMKNREQDFSN